MGQSKAQPAQPPPTAVPHAVADTQSIAVSMPQATVVTPDAPAAFDPPHAMPEPALVGAPDPQFSCGGMDIQLAICAQEPADGSSDGPAVPPQETPSPPTLATSPPNSTVAL